MIWKLGFLASVCWAIVSVVLSTNIVVVRRLNPNTTFPHFRDLFSNQQCSSSTCPARSTCAGGSCCMCECRYDFPNVFVKGTSVMCTNYDEMNRMSSANCQYSFGRPNEPLEVIPLIAKEKIRFKSADSARVNCAENSLLVDKWQYLDVDGRWENGKGKVFAVEFRTVGGSSGNKKDLTFLKMNAPLDAKYAGLIIKLSLSCAGRNVGCILAKINGTYTYTPPSTTTSTQQPSTDPTSTSVSEQSTRVPSPSTAEETTKAPTQSPDQLQASDKESAANNGSSSKVVWPVVGTIIGLIVLICSVCLIVALYKRRKKMLSEKPAKDPETESEPKLMNDYQDPLYAELPDNTKTTGDFDNPIYSDPTEEQIMRRSKLDPLPALPVGGESTYQPLDQNTRTVPGPTMNAPTPPPVSSDYLNPDREEPDTIDYDNPQVTNHVPVNNESSDYDNPPIQGNSPPMSTQKNENMNNDSSDYDNPPIQGNSPPMSTQRINNMNNASSDYDNPPVQDIPQGAPSESVTESTQGAATTEPEYLELEPPENSQL